MKKNSELTLSKFLAFLCFALYIASYTGRHNYSAALAQITSSGMFTKSQAGIIGTVFFAVYGIGQIVFGYLADRVSPYKLISAGLFGSALCNFSMAFSDSLSSMTVIWALNGVSQSVLWPGIFYIISNIVVKEYRSRACLIMSVGVPIGTMTAYFLAGAAIKTSWQRAFLYPSFIIFAAAVFFAAAAFFISKKIQPQGAENTAEKEKTSSRDYYKILILSGTVVLMLPVFLHGMLRDGINAWVPTMITETYSVSPSFSVFVSVVLPLINLTGAYIAVFIYERLTKGNEVLTAFVAVLCGIPPMLVLLFLGRISLTASVVMLASATTFITAFNHMIVTMLPLRFAKYNRAATLTGTLNFITYAGCAFSNLLFGYTSEHWGWSSTVIIWLALFAGCALILLPVIKKWKAFINCPF